MRLIAIAILMLTTTPVLAWEARSGIVCELAYDDDSASVLVTYDPATLDYAIAITPDRPWMNSPVFAMQFDGPLGNVITTDRHVISGGGATLTVTDRGFGNVLNGLEYNHTATALLGDRSISVPLAGAAPAVQEFRACTSSMSV